MRLQERETGKTIKEVRSRKEIKSTQRAMLLNFLKCKWQYAESTSYTKQFRQYKLIQMIREITFFLHDESAQSLLLENEQYILLSMIRAISSVIDGKSPANKAALEDHLERLEALIKRANKEGNNEQ